MKKTLILLFGVVWVSVSYALDFQDAKVQDHYFQILLKKWRESADWEELKGPICGLSPDFHFFHLIDSTVKEHYNIGLKEMRLLSPGRYRYAYTMMGERNEYYLARIRKKKEKKQIWVLVSNIHINHKVLSIYADEIHNTIQVKKKLPIAYSREHETQNIYAYLLENEESSQCIPSWKSRNVNEHTSSYKDIDSATAVSVAVKAAIGCYGKEMTPFAAMPVGNNNEYWMVYCFPTIIKRDAIQLICLITLTTKYYDGMLWLTSCLNCTTATCPTTPVGILISRKDGRVQSIKVLEGN
jgi:hypothetical protein